DDEHEEQAQEHLPNRIGDVVDRPLGRPGERVDEEAEASAGDGADQREGGAVTSEHAAEKTTNRGRRHPVDQPARLRATGSGAASPPIGAGAIPKKRWMTTRPA